MLVQKTNYSHVYLKYQDNFLNQPMYYGASHTLVNYMSAPVFLAQETVVKEFTFNISDEMFVSTLLFAAQQAGKPYGVWEIIGLGIMNVSLLFGIKINNPFANAGSNWICDQLMAALLSQCANITLPIPLNDMTPKDMYNFVSSLPQNLS